MTSPQYRAAQWPSSGPVVHWWDRLPGPVTSVALGAWSRLPGVVRRPLSRLTPLINPHAVAVARPVPGPDTVVGVSEARSAGFTPVEELTGWWEIALAWPPRHRRELRESRTDILESAADRSLWLVRSPWPSITVEDAVSLVWVGEHDREDSREARLAHASDVLRWSEARAGAALAER